MKYSTGALAGLRGAEERHLIRWTKGQPFSFDKYYIIVEYLMGLDHEDVRYMMDNNWSWPDIWQVADSNLRRA